MVEFCLLVELHREGSALQPGSRRCSVFISFKNLSKVLCNYFFFDWKKLHLFAVLKFKRDSLQGVNCAWCSPLHCIHTCAVFPSRSLAGPRRHSWRRGGGPCQGSRQVNYLDICVGIWYKLNSAFPLPPPGSPFPVPPPPWPAWRPRPGSWGGRLGCWPASCPWILLARPLYRSVQQFPTAVLLMDLCIHLSFSLPPSPSLNVTVLWFPPN